MISGHPQVFIPGISAAAKLSVFEKFIQSLRRK